MTDSQDFQIDQLVAQCKQKLEAGGDLEAVLQYLRNETGRKTVSVAVVADVLQIPIGEAKILVHNSPAWSDLKAQHEAFESDVLGDLTSTTSDSQ